MDSGRLRTRLLLLVFLGTLATTSALECYFADGMPDTRTSTDRTQVCQQDDTSCYEYEGNPHMPAVFRLVYYAGCGKKESCDYNVRYGNCSVCDTDKCNNALIADIRSTARHCYSYFASYDSVGVMDLSTQTVVCPSDVNECFQVHFPAGSHYSAWTQFTGGCGNEKAGCSREFPHTKCTVCSENLCNMPKAPGIATRISGDQPDSEAAGTGPTGMVTALALALTIGAAALF